MSPRSAALLGLAFALLAALVAAGVLTGLDQWAVSNAMPGAHFGHEQTRLVDSLIPLYHVRWGSAYSTAVNVVTLPASFLLALAISFACSRAFGLGLLAVVAVEVLCKEAIDRPALHHGSLHVLAFDSSFPSGHASRAVVVATAVASVRPRLRGAAVAWVLACLVLLLLAGWHTPTDLAGGVLLGLLGAGAARALRRRLLARTRGR